MGSGADGGRGPRALNRLSVPDPSTVGVKQSNRLSSVSGSDQGVNQAHPFESDPSSGPLAALVERGECPSDWYKWSQAAYLYQLWANSKKVARAVGVSERTLYNWRHDARWPVFMDHSEELWLSDVYQAARLRVLRALAEDTPHSQRLAERILEGRLPGLSQQQSGNGQSLPGGVNVGVVVGLPAQDTGDRGGVIVDQAEVLRLGEIPDEER